MTKISGKEVLRCNVRLFRTWWALSPQFLLSTVLSCAASASLPYVILYFTAQLLGGIAAGQAANVLWHQLLTLLLVSAAVGVVSALLTRWKNAVLASVHFLEAKHYAEKFLSMDYVVADDPAVCGLYDNVRQNANWSCWGLPRLVDNQLEDLSTALSQTVGALILTAGLFRGTALRSASLFALLILTAWASSVLYNKGAAYWSRAGEDVKLSNRMFSFYTYAAFHQRKRALDIRMYGQDRFFNKGVELMGDVALSEKSPMAHWARGPMGRLYFLSESLPRLSLGVLDLYICLRAWGGAFAIGTAAQYLGAVTGLSRGISNLLITLGDMRANTPYLRLAYSYLDTPNRMYRGSLTTEKRRDCQYEVEFRDVSFRYPGSEDYALRHVSIKFRVGRRLAVVGQNGSGKTTFIKLLTRLYDPTEGEILLNGIDIRKYRYEDYLDLFSVVFQDFRLLALPLGENVAGSPDYDREKAEKCLREAGFGDRLDALPQGLDTCLYRDFDKDGVEISGGEAQKIAIARALYKDAPILILDEPTAALDPLAEAEIYSKFSQVVGKKTAIYISHRLSSCRFCDEIAVFDRGQIVQQGSHETLLNDGAGKYYELWHAQAQYYEKKA